MIKKGLTVLALFLVAITTAWADSPGPYPVIFVHGQQSGGSNSSGWGTWNDSESHMRKLNGYNGYSYGSPKDCNVNSTVSSTGGNAKKVYNFSYYNPDGSRGVIGDDYASATLYPKSTDYQSDYATSEANGEWAEHLADFIDKVLVATGASKVNLVCHSMGGLVTRNAINFFGCKDKVYKVMMIGTPNHGFDFKPYVEALYANSDIADYPEWQQRGELLEMSLNSDWILESVKFKNTVSIWSKKWTTWLHDEDKPFIRGRNNSDNAPFYATIAGDLRRYWSYVYPCVTPAGVHLCLFPPNDGVVAKKSVKLSYADFHRTYLKWHHRDEGDDANKCLPTCNVVRGHVKKWIYDYHVAPEIYRVRWTQTNGAMSAMSIMSATPKYKGRVYFRYTETAGWKTKRFKCYRKKPGKSWNKHKTLYDGSKRNYIGKRKVKAGVTWCFKVEAVHKYKTGSEQFLMGDPYCSAPTSQSPPDPGCPMLYTFSGIDDSTGVYLFDQENTLLAHSEVFFDTLPDHLVLSDPPPALNGHYYLHVSEDSTATSYFDEARLYVVDHPATTGLTASLDGDPYVYSDLILPNECYTYEIEVYEDSLGELHDILHPVDLLDEILYVDTLSIVGNNLDSFFVTFPEPVDWPNTGIVMTTASVSPSAAISPVKDYYYTAYMSTGDSGWSSIPGGQAFARHYPSSWAAELPSSSAFLSTEEDGITIKIVCNANTIGYFNSIVLIKIEQDGWTMTEAPLDSAIHWHFEYGVPTSTDVKTQLFAQDGIIAPYLEAGEQYALSFSALPDTLDTTLVRDFILKTHGVYGYALQSSSEIEEHGFLPREYDLRIGQTLTSQSLRIAYQLPEAGRTTISVIDVTGRQVALLVHDDMGAGSYTLNWDGKYGTGQKIVPGVYFVRMVSGDFARSAKVIILN